ncbi:hypothetical protein K490DRAFT_72056 [Saccharata proteae CBS 121410]|uniref:Carboxymuconolactone decarboxylase-like domain-containing protein n=1 Tax=Saccharata proteae CBS 121410 TaxID=1314787 RepID=A0A6A5YEK3_9PEZI|nr:hypothetical protein K490DRAFT_72056 [Saccharata proteae CBS 121410]
MPLNIPTVLTPTLLRTLRTHPNLPQHTWYFVAGVTLSALNRPDEVPRILTHALEHDAPPSNAQSSDEQLRIARRMREGLVKSAAVIGLPKTINSLLALKTATPEHLLDEPMSYSPSARPVDVYDTPPSAILHRGQTFFDRVYGKVSKRVMGQMDRSGTEDLGIVARLMYGYLLSNERVLDARDSSFVLVAALVPQDVNPQLKGHLKGALGNGAKVEEVMAVREIVIKICEATGMKQLGPDSPGGWGWREEVAKL